MAKQPQNPGTQQGPAQAQQSAPAAAQANAASPAAAAREAQLVQLTIAPARAIPTTQRLRELPRVTVAFPPCAEELLSLIKTSDRDDITVAFKDYFKFYRHQILGQDNSGGTLQDLDQKVAAELDPDLRNCESGGIILHGPQTSDWPSDCCLCTPCVTLDGVRNPSADHGAPPVPGMRRLCAGDVVWLFYHERMGVHQVLGAILDAFATSGRLPISNGSLDLGVNTNIVRDDITALILEIMVRQTKMGMSSSVRDRGALYRTSLGWESGLARPLKLDTEVNTGFSSLFHRFIFNALEFYRDKRLAVAIQSTAVPTARPSVATLITLSDTIDVLKKRFEAFSYGRNYYNALAGIVWTVSAMSVIRELRGTLGIPSAFEAAHEFIPAAYDLLVLKRPVTRGDVNRYEVHRSCAVNGRDILLDLEVIDHKKNQPGEELEDWLNQVEAKVEGYRTAYRNLTGVDLGASASTAVEQQVQAAA
ncbi:MAG TPA: hypothetical protein VFS49_01405 [Croceibacterium sp.]|nr:hypothetical protein [Croceibacterium sp.]